MGERAVTLIPLDEVEWRRTRIIKNHLSATDDESAWWWEFDLPRPLADWDVFSYWERARFDSMRTHLKPGTVLFDVGTEQGWCNLAYASIVGPENMVLIEPTPEFWPNIRATWERNYEQPPLACFQGLMSALTGRSVRPDDFRDWPAVSKGPLIRRNS